jgi:phospholipid/cholesterol/gamma-HCH transport system substrate-binding protein
MSRLPTRLLAGLATIVVLAVVVSAAVVLVIRHQRHMTITTYFTESNGIYPGNHVDILGLSVGSVASVTPEPHRVKVVLDLPKGTKIPTDAQAYIVPPSVISDRYVGLSPAWNGGPTLASGAVLNTDKTHVPAEFDDLVGSLTTLFNALGPKEANAKGTVGRLIHVLSANLDGNGTKIHTTIQGLASATSALTSDRGGLAAVITSLDTLSKNLAARDALIGSFNSDLATASTQLAAERGDITAVVGNLTQGLVQLATFLRSHKADLHGTLRDLVGTTNTLLAHQRELIDTLDNLPLAGQNISRVNRGGAIVVQQVTEADDPVLTRQLKLVCTALPTLCNALSIPLAKPAKSGRHTPRGTPLSSLLGSPPGAKQ